MDAKTAAKTAIESLTEDQAQVISALIDNLVEANEYERLLAIDRNDGRIAAAGL